MAYTCMIVVKFAHLKKHALGIISWTLTTLQAATTLGAMATKILVLAT